MQIGRVAVASCSFIAIPALIFSLVLSGAAAGELADERARFDECEHHDGPAGIYPRDPHDDPEVRFFFMADIERAGKNECKDKRLVTVQHVVRNMHATNDFHFIWDPLDNSAALKGPGAVWRLAGSFERYNGTLASGRIRFGATLNDYSPFVSASYYPFPEPRADMTRPLGSAVAYSLEVDQDIGTGESERLSVEVTSSYEREIESMRYTLARSRDDLVVALGNIAHEELGQEMAEQLSADVAPLFKLVENLDTMPDIFRDGDYIIIHAEAKINKDVFVTGNPNRMLVSPVAMLTADFEPIATASFLLLSP